VNEIRTTVVRTLDAPVRNYARSVRRGLAVLAAIVLALVATGPLGAGTAKPPIAGTTLDGKRVALADLRGKPVVINVWSSW
jgi:hypothetical protein